MCAKATHMVTPLPSKRFPASFVGTKSSGKHSGLRTHARAVSQDPDKSWQKFSRAGMLAVRRTKAPCAPSRSTWMSATCTAQEGAVRLKCEGAYSDYRDARTRDVPYSLSIEVGVDSVKVLGSPGLDAVYEIHLRR